MSTTAVRVAELEEAKRNVVWILEHPTGLVDMKGLVYWAGVVERLRNQISGSL